MEKGDGKKKTANGEAPPPTGFKIAYKALHRLNALFKGGIGDVLLVIFLMVGDFFF